MTGLLEFQRDDEQSSDNTVVQGRGACQSRDLSWGVGGARFAVCKVYVVPAGAEVMCELLSNLLMISSVTLWMVVCVAAQMRIGDQP